MFTLDKDLIVFDLETSGITDQSSILQIGAVRFTKKGKIRSDQTFNQFVIPYNEEWSEEAYKIHGLTQEFLYKNGAELDEVIANFNKWIYQNTSREIYLAQWSCGFDTQMLSNAHKLLNIKFPYSHRSFDVASIVRFHIATKGGNTSKGLFECCKFLKIDTKKFKAHDALSDAYLTALALEKVVDENSN
jgi:DNA polymerase III epsilon subunit-like protein